MDHASRAVLAQAQVEATVNEIARFRPLLDPLDLSVTVITADAMHTQREHADWLVTHKHAAYILLVKANQPTLHQQLKRLPWRQILIADTTRDRGHGRVDSGDGGQQARGAAPRSRPPWPLRTDSKARSAQGRGPTPGR
jgi:predicted transposase YbfD/YdcC